MRISVKCKIVAVYMILLIVSVFASCERKKDPVILSSPKNVSITVEGRIMTVTWDAVDRAQGYIVVLTSEGCGSGNRTIDTRAGTSVITSSGKDASNVEITRETEIKVVLMAARGDPNSAMAKAVTAKVMSIGGTVSKKIYNDSDFSEIAREEL